MVYFRHGMKGTKIYEVWHAMKARCHRPKHKFYPRYGGRGITVCERWLDFKNFFADMGDVPEGMTLERLDNDKGYYKDNCEWATQKGQTRNRSNNKMVTYNGKTKCLQAWADQLGMNKRTLRERIVRSGWSIEKALTTPVETRTYKDSNENQVS